MVRFYPVYTASSADTEAPSQDLYMSKVLDRTDCKKHRAALGIPCFQLLRENENGLSLGICNARAKRAGFNNPIRDRSLWLGNFSRAERPYR